MKPFFNLEVYRERRQRLLDVLDNGVLILPAAPTRTHSNDVLYSYRPSNQLSYLTGFEEPETVLVLVKGDPSRLILFVRPRDPDRETWDGKRAGVEGAKSAFGADEVYELAELDEKLPEILDRQPIIYHTLNQHQGTDQAIFKAMQALAGGRGKPERAPECIIDPRRRLNDVRRVKYPEEIALMREAVDIAREAHIDAMKTIKPGVTEYEVAARLDYVFRGRGAAGPGYETIVGGGENATILHYVENQDELRDGTLVLIDAGCEYKRYNSDITRTFPVGPRFSAAQRDLYQAVLDVQKEGIARVRPGESAHELTLWSRRAISQKLVDLGLLSGSIDEIIEKKTYKRFYMHNLGHYLGMDVHDVGTYLVDEDQPLPLEAGVVLTVEPGIYVPAEGEDIPEDMRGVGIRIEDDVLLTSDGGEVLSHGVPKEIDDIEALRREAFP